MGIEAGFTSQGFTDDREEQERWNKIDEKLTNPAPEPTTQIDGKLEMDAKTTDWEKDLSGINQRDLARRQGNGKTFLQRNKQQIFDALIILGAIYIGYKLLWESDGGDGEYDGGGEVSYQAPPSPPTPQPAPVEPAPPVTPAEQPNSMDNG